jgi:exodeoxyribonuclease VII small subunit
MKDFEKRLERLEAISEQIKDGEVPLDKAVSLFEEGTKLARDLEKDLSKIERKIEILQNEPDTPEDTPDLSLFPELEENS